MLLCLINAESAKQVMEKWRKWEMEIQKYEKYKYSRKIEIKTLKEKSAPAVSETDTRAPGTALSDSSFPVQQCCQFDKLWFYYKFLLQNSR